jgi:hypothetical protein
MQLEEKNYKDHYYLLKEAFPEKNIKNKKDIFESNKPQHNGQQLLNQMKNQEMEIDHWTLILSKVVQRSQ